jgi:hypothetical protein
LHSREVMPFPVGGSMPELPEQWHGPIPTTGN